jgi:hypothetical protein
MAARLKLCWVPFCDGPAVATMRLVAPDGTTASVQACAEHSGRTIQARFSEPSRIPTKASKRKQPRRSETDESER